MEFRVAQTSEKQQHSVYLFSALEQIDHLLQSDGEKQYVAAGIEEGKTIIRLNHYPDFVYFVYQKSTEMAAYAKDEQLRIKGNKLVRMLSVKTVKGLYIESVDESINALAFAEGIVLGNYKFLKYFSDADKKASALTHIDIAGSDKKEIKQANAVLKGVFSARDLVNEPVNFLTAKQLAKELQERLENAGAHVEVFGKKKIEALKMGGLLAVNSGSQDPPSFSIIEYKPENASNKKPLVLVGKGVVYDTGGLSLKPTAGSMDSMKSDMGGAAAVIGALEAVALAKLPVHVIGLIPATDNRPGEKAYTPGDVIKMYDGTTVEVLNTDAEGRMILADALTYAKKYKPELVIDLATLTGAAAVAIGKFGVVGMGNASDDAFAKLNTSGENVYERVVRFPFWDEYNDLLKSSIADVKNIGGREGGAITAGKFLERFTDYPYIHLDIAGPAFLGGDDHYRKQGGTGVGVRLLFDFIKNYK